ncbi:MAG TPA: EAL domain-containing protein [Caulobacterales bacterium]|nr:EAL domain-containing protein [Caulobacterales bacterium]
MSATETLLRLHRSWAAAKAAFDTAHAPAQGAIDWLRAAVDALPEGIVFLDPEGRYILWNKRYAEIYAKSADLFQPGARLADTLRIGVQRGDYPESAGREEEWIAERLAKLANPQAPHEQRLSDGRWILIEERKMTDGCTIGLRVDVTEIKRKEEGFRLLFDANPVPMFLYDAHTRRILEANDAACAHYAYKREALAGRDVGIIYNEELDKLHRNGPARHVKGDGALIEAATFSQELTHNGREAILLAAVDVTERRKAEARLAHMARHDALTNLPNRVYFREAVEEQLSHLGPVGDGFALCLFDLDHFKAVNDTLGHSVGDLLLQAVATRVRKHLKTGDILARLGGDEFALIHAGGDPMAIGELVDCIITDVSQPYDIDGHQVQIGVSVGVSIAPQDGDNPDRLLKNADLALYAAKAQGRGQFLFFDSAMDDALQSRRRLELDLRAALENGELCVFYQPLMNLSTKQPSGFEALVRWRHPQNGLISPAHFVPLAEDTGLIGPIGEMVLRQACKDAASWPIPAKVAVNLSPIQFRSCDVLATVMEALSETGLPPAHLELEITEALLLERDDKVLATLNGLRALGVGISMDDFGTGYSSLSYLRSFPFTKIKIDQSFVRDLRASADSKAIIRAILSLGENLGMSVLAEGIETEEDLAFLISEGCIEGQGYLFSPPRPMAELFPNVEAAEAQVEDFIARFGLKPEKLRDVG